MFLTQTRAIGDQTIAYRGIVDATGRITGLPGIYVGSGQPGLTTDKLGRTNYFPGYNIELGYKFEDGTRIYAKYLQLFQANYNDGATVATQYSRSNTSLTDTFLVAGVFNFSPQFAGPQQKTIYDFQPQTFQPQQIVLNDVVQTTITTVGPPPSTITTTATEPVRGHDPRADEPDVRAGRVQPRVQHLRHLERGGHDGHPVQPVVPRPRSAAGLPLFQTDYSRVYGLGGGRFDWFFERFIGGRTTTSTATAPRRPGRRYNNTLSQRMYGPFVGCGHEVYLGKRFSLSLDLTAAALLGRRQGAGQVRARGPVAPNKRCRNELHARPVVHRGPQPVVVPDRGGPGAGRVQRLDVLQHQVHAGPDRVQLRRPSTRSTTSSVPHHPRDQLGRRAVLLTPRPERDAPMPRPAGRRAPGAAAGPAGFSPFPRPIAAPAVGRIIRPVRRGRPAGPRGRGRTTDEEPAWPTGVTSHRGFSPRGRSRGRKSSAASRSPSTPGSCWSPPPASWRCRSAGTSCRPSSTTPSRRTEPDYGDEATAQGERGDKPGTKPTGQDTRRTTSGRAGRATYEARPRAVAGRWTSWPARRGRLRTLPWDEYRGPNPYLFVTDVLSGTAGRAGRRRSPSSSPAPSRCWSSRWSSCSSRSPKLIAPGGQPADPALPAPACSGAWPSWAFFGGVITRLAAVQLTNKGPVTLRQAVRFVAARYLTTCSPRSSRCAIIAAVIVGLILYGLVALIPFVGDIVLLGLGLPLVILGGAVMAILLVGLVGYPLMYATAQRRGGQSDTFDALSRSFNYVYQAPWQLHLVLARGGRVRGRGHPVRGVLRVADGVPREVGGRARRRASETSDRKPDYLFIYAPESFGWRELFLQGQPGRGAGREDDREPENDRPGWSNGTSRRTRQRREQPRRTF